MMGIDRSLAGSRQARAALWPDMQTCTQAATWAGTQARRSSCEALENERKGGSRGGITGQVGPLGRAAPHVLISVGCRTAAERLQSGWCSRRALAGREYMTADFILWSFSFVVERYHALHM